MPEIEAVVLGAPPGRGSEDDQVDFTKLGAACRHGKKLHVRYVDLSGATTERTVWPLLVGYEGRTRIWGAFCELRQDFRVFLTHRLLEVTYLDERYPARRETLRRQWLARMAERRG